MTKAKMTRLPIDARSRARCHQSQLIGLTPRARSDLPASEGVCPHLLNKEPVESR